MDFIENIENHDEKSNRWTSDTVINSSKWIEAHSRQTQEILAMLLEKQVRLGGYRIGSYDQINPLISKSSVLEREHDENISSCDKKLLKGFHESPVLRFETSKKERVLEPNLRFTESQGSIPRSCSRGRPRSSRSRHVKLRKKDEISTNKHGHKNRGGDHTKLSSINRSLGSGECTTSAETFALKQSSFSEADSEQEKELETRTMNLSEKHGKVASTDSAHTDGHNSSESLANTCQLEYCIRTDNTEESEPSKREKHRSRPRVVSGRRFCGRSRASRRPLFKVIDYRNNNVGESYSESVWDRSTRNAKLQVNQVSEQSLKEKESTVSTSSVTSQSVEEETDSNDTKRVYLVPKEALSIRSSHAKQSVQTVRRRRSDAKTRLQPRPPEQHLLTETLADKITNLFQTIAEVDFAALRRKIAFGLSNALKSDNIFKRNREMNKRLEEVRTIKFGWSFGGPNSRWEMNMLHQDPKLEDTYTKPNRTNHDKLLRNQEGFYRGSLPYRGLQNSSWISGDRSLSASQRKMRNKQFADQVLAQMKSGTVFEVPTSYFKKQYEECVYQKNVMELKTKLRDMPIDF